MFCNFLTNYRIWCDFHVASRYRFISVLCTGLKSMLIMWSETAYEYNPSLSLVSLANDNSELHQEGYIVGIVYVLSICHQNKSSFLCA